MTADLRQLVYGRHTPVRLTGEVECDEIYLVAGHKGQPAIVHERGREGRRGALCDRLKGARGRGTLAAEKPPLFGMIQRAGALIIHLLPNVQPSTIQRDVQPGTLIYTDEYNIYARLIEWGYAHKTVNHSQAGMPVMKMATPSMKSIPTRWKAFGLSYALGCGLIVVSRKKNCPSTWLF